MLDVVPMGRFFRAIISSSSGRRDQGFPIQGTTPTASRALKKTDFGSLWPRALLSHNRSRFGITT